MTLPFSDSGKGMDKKEQAQITRQLNKAAREAAQDARRTFPEYFAGKSDQEIISEIVGAVKKEAEQHG